MLKIPPHLSEGMLRMKLGAVGVADKVPVYAQISHHSAKIVGESSIRFFTDAETFLRCELAADEFYDIDAPTIHYDVYNIESEALGAKLIWEERHIPTVDQKNPFLSSVDDFNALRPFKVGSAGRMPYVIEINKRLIDLGLAPKIRFTGLFTLSANLMGLQNLIMAIITKPDSVHRLMSFLTDEVVAPWIICQREQCKCHEVATGSDALASPPMLSIDMVREFCLKYIKELDKKIGGIRLTGLWGESHVSNPKQLLDIKREGSSTLIQVLDPDVSSLGPGFFRKYAEQAGIGLIMGIDAHLVASGPITAIKSRVRRFIEEGGKKGRFVLFINDIPYETPPENVRAIISVAREYHSDPTGTCYIC